MITYLILFASWASVVLYLLITTLTLFLAVIKLRDMQDAGTLQDLHWSAKWICYLILYVGYLSDALLNWVGLTVTMFEPPQEVLCTERVKRHKNYGSGWRRAQAIWWCRGWLTPVDERHCDK